MRKRLEVALSSQMAFSLNDERLNTPGDGIALTGTGPPDM
jgi:hypothetical protein